MDLEEWELLPDDGFLEIHDDGGKKIYSRKYGSTDSKSVFDMDYFLCPSPKPQKFVDSTPPENSRVRKQQLVPVPIQLEPTIFGKAPQPVDDHEEPAVKKITSNKVPIEIISMMPSAVADQNMMMIKSPSCVGAVEADDQDTVSQVFFKKMKENEFVDMKMDSPKSGSRPGSIMPQVDVGSFQFEAADNGDQYQKEVLVTMACKKNNHHHHHLQVDSDTTTTTTSKEEEEEEDSINGGGGGGGLNIWKWSLSGVGAICSFGVAAATVCIIIFGTHRQRNKQPHQLNHQKLRFQIYAEDKRIKQVVHHATKLNEAISAVRGVPVTRAHITVGGYYDAL